MSFSLPQLVALKSSYKDPIWSLKLPTICVTLLKTFLSWFKKNLTQGFALKQIFIQFYNKYIVFKLKWEWKLAFKCMKKVLNLTVLINGILKFFPKHFES